MATGDDFTFIDDEGHRGPPQLFPDYHKLTSGKLADPDVQVVTALREKHPDLIVTAVPTGNISLLQFAAAGFAQAVLDDDTEPVLRWRVFNGPAHRGGSGYLADSTFFARYNYTWNGENFVFYNALVGRILMQYILKEPREGETTTSHSSAVDRLLSTIGAWLLREEPAIYVYDGYWSRDTKLWKEVEKARWEDVILDPKMKKAVTGVANKFFDNEDIYKEYGVPWKRGLIFYGPVGNGKTISLKALMHTVQERKKPVVTLYVKRAPNAYSIRSVFQMARGMTPCLLVLEDIDTIVTPGNRSYFFNEVDGLENNDGILMIATTNHLDELDPGLSKRPSRFDRKYLFPLPNKGERSQYAQYWRNKLKNKPSIEFPGKLCDAIADITEDFSFAYLKEAFVASLLELARNHGDDDDDEESCGDDDDDPLDKYEFWRVIKVQVKMLRDDMGSETVAESGATVGAYEGFPAGYEEMLPLLENMRLQGSLQQQQSQHQAMPSQGVAEPISRLTESGSSVISPAHTFAPLAQNKCGKLVKEAWEWGP